MPVPWKNLLLISILVLDYIIVVHTRQEGYLKEEGTVFAKKVITYAYFLP